MWCFYVEIIFYSSPWCGIFQSSPRYEILRYSALDFSVGIWKRIFTLYIFTVPQHMQFASKPFLSIRERWSSWIAIFVYCFRSTLRTTSVQLQLNIIHKIVLAILQSISETSRGVNIGTWTGSSDFQVPRWNYEFMDEYNIRLVFFFAAFPEKWTHEQNGKLKIVQQSPDIRPQRVTKPFIILNIFSSPSKIRSDDESPGPPEFPLTEEKRMEIQTGNNTTDLSAVDHRLIDRSISP